MTGRLGRAKAAKARCGTAPAARRCPPCELA